MAAAARAPPGGGGGQTQIRNPAEAGPAVTTHAPTQAVLHLRGATMQQEVEQEVERRNITWAEDVVDNEGMGRKSSKVCCIYHTPKGIDESSDESSSDESSSDESSSDSSSDSDSGDDGSARPARRQGVGGGHGHNHNHNHDHGKGKGKGKGRARSPNAYEKVPKPKSGGAKDKT